ncbi:MAG: Methyltransferase type 11 domain protein [Candidatus Syntrophoarchaeum caldarius]|uniref:Methyltransferase type 11 domain protein n=1 Tax=Candidatus Syntropharchaeum caldarium TaxID=1838285 RepID=A0A1F2P7I5_9EURY|nr:MAG: Methyltransferase type 11 domain protein [Candidatus Syntrophoarchaeum caldarius]
MQEFHRKTLVSAFYSERAESYEDAIRRHPVISSIRERIVNGLHLKNNACILDLGCGSGITGFEIRSRFDDVRIVGVDIADEMVKVAKRSAASEGYDTMEFLIGDMESIPFRDLTFDLILCINAIRYLKSLERILAEIYRVLNDGGEFILIDSDRESEHMNDEGSKMRVLKKHPLEEAFINSDGWNMMYNKDEIREGLVTAKFEKIFIESEKMYFIARASKRCGIDGPDAI